MHTARPSVTDGARVRQRKRAGCVYDAAGPCGASNQDHATHYIRSDACPAMQKGPGMNTSRPARCGVHTIGQGPTSSSLACCAPRWQCKRGRMPTRHPAWLMKTKCGVPSRHPV